MESKTIFEQLLSDYPALQGCTAQLREAYSILHRCYEKGGKLLLCGNGGSAADCEHIAGELLKGFNLRRPLSETERAGFAGIDGGEEIANRLQGALPAISLVSQVGLISAFANDVDASLVYAQQVWAYAKKDDVLLALSTSGNSLNIVNAVKTTKAAGICSIAITGGKDSLLSALATTTIRLPKYTPFEVQELTLPVYHALCAMLEADFFSC